MFFNAPIVNSATGKMPWSAPNATFAGDTEAEHQQDHRVGVIFGIE